MGWIEWLESGFRMEIERIHFQRRAVSLNCLCKPEEKGERKSGTFFSKVQIRVPLWWECTALVKNAMN